MAHDGTSSKKKHPQTPTRYGAPGRRVHCWATWDFWKHSHLWSSLLILCAGGTNGGWYWLRCWFSNLILRDSVHQKNAGHSTNLLVHYCLSNTLVSPIKLDHHCPKERFLCSAQPEGAPIFCLPCKFVIHSWSETLVQILVQSHL